MEHHFYCLSGIIFFLMLWLPLSIIVILVDKQSECKIRPFVEMNMFHWIENGQPPFFWHSWNNSSSGGDTAYNYLTELDYDSNCNQDFIDLPCTCILGTQPPQGSVYLIKQFSCRYGIMVFTDLALNAWPGKTLDLLIVVSVSMLFGFDLSVRVLHSCMKR